MRVYNFRHNKYPVGFYKEFKKTKYQYKKKSNLIKPNKLCMKELNSLNYLILKHLKINSRRSPLVKVKMEPSKIFSNYLINNYGLSNRFINGTQFLIDQNFYLKRFFNTFDYCTLMKNDNGDSCFRLKLTKPRRLSFHSDESLNLKGIFYKEILHIQFVRTFKKKII